MKYMKLGSKPDSFHTDGNNARWVVSSIFLVTVIFGYWFLLDLEELVGLWGISSLILLAGCFLFPRSCNQLDPGTCC